MMPIFTLEELGGYEIEQLQRLAEYFKVPLEDKMSKGRIIERIYRKLEEMDRAKAVSHLVNDDGHPVSVRVRRILNSSKEKTG